MIDNERRNLKTRLEDLTRRINSIDDDNDTAHTFTRTGILMIRAGLTLIDDGDRARAQAADWSARGYPTATNKEPGRDTSREDEDGDVALTSVEAAATTSDHWERTVTMLDHERRILDTNARSIEHRIANTVRVMPNEGRRTTLIDCANPHCDNTITGLGNDRPRRGRCRRCFGFLERNGRDWTARQEPCDHHETAGR